MFHLQQIELLHWDYCERISLPLDAAIVTIAGPNGSGKTTLLDALRTLLGLECSGGRSYKTYARHTGSSSGWLRAVVDNRPVNRQNSSRPFATSLLYADQVTLACRIERNGGDWQRRYLMAEGDVAVESLIERPEKDALGVVDWRKRLAAAGLTPAIARVLSLEQGQTDRLCEYNPRELLKLVFDVFGDQEVLDSYERARGHQQQLAREVEQAERELAHSRVQLAELQQRCTNYRQHQLKLRERERLATEVVPVLNWAEQRAELVKDLHELHRQRLHALPRAGPDLLHCFLDTRLARGYLAWVAPAPGFFQVGLAVSQPAKADLKAFLSHTEPLFGFSGASVKERRSGLIPCGGPVSPCAAPNVMLIGDAAGHVSPLTGGGIRLAFRFGRRAGQLIADHLTRHGPPPDAVLARELPGFARKLLLRTVMEAGPPNWLYNATIGTAAMGWFARQVYFHHRAGPEDHGADD